MELPTAFDHQKKTVEAVREPSLFLRYSDVTLFQNAISLNAAGLFDHCVFVGTVKAGYRQAGMRVFIKYTVITTPEEDQRMLAEFTMHRALSQFACEKVRSRTSTASFREPDQPDEVQLSIEQSVGETNISMLLDFTIQYVNLLALVTDPVAREELSRVGISHAPLRGYLLVSADAGASLPAIFPTRLAARPVDPALVVSCGKQMLCVLHTLFCVGFNHGDLYLRNVAMSAARYNFGFYLGKEKYVQEKNTPLFRMLDFGRSKMHFRDARAREITHDLSPGFLFDAVRDTRSLGYSLAFAVAPSLTEATYDVFVKSGCLLMINLMISDATHAVEFSLKDRTACLALAQRLVATPQDDYVRLALATHGAHLLPYEVLQQAGFIENGAALPDGVIDLTLRPVIGPGVRYRPEEQTDRLALASLALRI